MTSGGGPRRVAEHFYLVGEVEWLPVEQGGRQSGPPQPKGQDYISTAALAPAEIDASFVLREWDGSQRSSARGRWLVDENPDRPLVGAGDIVMVKEGARVVARFRVTGVEGQPAKTAAPAPHKGWLSRWRRR
jgi:hypothetical protein